MDSPQIKLPNETTAGLYVGFAPTPGRIEKGCKITACARCSRWTGHWPKESHGYEIVCLACANDVPTIRQHIDQLAKERG